MFRLYMEERLIVYLMHLKIMPNLKGYKYIKEAAMRVCEDSRKKIKMTQNLYKELSEEYGDKVSLLDRSLRHAMEVCYKRNGIHDFENFTKIYFAERRPSAREIICVLAELLKIDLYDKFKNFPMS